MGLQSAASGRGSSTLIRGFSHQRFEVGSSLTMDAGLHVQYFALSTEVSVEPRGSIRVDLTGGHALSAGYGLHSQIEDLRIYFADTGEPDRFPNTDLGMTKAHHAVLGYDVKLGDVSRLRAEGYYQYLFDVPVIADSVYSLINFEQDFEFRNALVNDGAGRNYGVELTIERFLKDGFYFLVTGSLFKSMFRGGDDVWRNSRFDRMFATNALFGREFLIRRSGSVLGINGRLTYNGGHRYSPVDQTASADVREVVFDESMVFSERAPAQAVVDLTITYRRNKRRYASAWALQVKNVLGAGLLYHDFDYTTGRVEELHDAIVLPVLSYKVEF